jgi:hypothetical protein
MLFEGVMILAWLGAGAAVGSLLTYRLYTGLVGQEREGKLQSCLVENEALARTNLIYREKIEQLEKALFSNKTYIEMTGEIEKLRTDNFKLRSRLRDLECLVEAEKKKASRERVERLERTVYELRSRLEKEIYRPETPCLVEVLPAQTEVAVTTEPGPRNNNEPVREQKKWVPVIRAKKLT